MVDAAIGLQECDRSLAAKRHSGKCGPEPFADASLRGRCHSGARRLKYDQRVYDSIVVGTDGSPSAKRAVAQGARLAFHIELSVMS